MKIFEKKYKVTFLILNYKTYKDTINLANELMSFSGYGSEYGLVIVDNASPNESWTALNTHLGSQPDVYLVQSKENGGFAKGNNIGLRFMAHCRPDYVCVINNDVHFSSETIENLCKWYKLLPNAAFIAPRQILPNGKEALFSSMDIPTLRTDLAWYNPFSRKRHLYTENTSVKGIHEIGIIPGAFIFTDYKTFETLGFFDESTFLFCEERFIAKKAQLAGLKNYIILGETYLHNHSTTIKNEASEERQRKLILRGRLLYHRKYSSHPILSVGALRFVFFLNEAYLRIIKVVQKIKHCIK